MPLPKCLLAEDNPDDALFITRNLRDIATVHIAANRAELNRLLESHKFDVILLDYSPFGDAAIKSIEKLHPTTPVILVTGSISHEAARALCSSQVCDYIIKGIDFERLDIAVKNAYEKSLKQEENEKLKAQTLQNQRHEILGTLAASLSHDVNNFLGVITMGISSLRDPHQKPADRKRVLDSMEGAANRGAAMVKGVMTFAKGDINGSTYKVVSAATIMTEMGRMMRHVIDDSKIRLSVRTEVDTSSVRCNQTQINTVLVNMALNAKQAMVNGGDLFIEARDVVMREPPLEGHYVCMTVKDTGPGILPENIEHIWTPYFTTKGSKGTGLGLSMVKPIVEAHGGAVRVASDSTGTLFSIFLPVVVTQVETPQEAFNGNGAVVVLSDDEETFRDVVRRSLEEANYKVLSACNGLEALSFFRSHPRIDILVSDVSMQIMGGVELLRNLRLQGFNTPTIFMTGLEFESKIDPEPEGIISKPFSREMLLRKLQAVLTPSSGSAQPAL
jgi:two-component system cell cycle sensor histidine kinase/response regulator CckA